MSGPSPGCVRVFEVDSRLRLATGLLVEEGVGEITLIAHASDIESDVLAEGLLDIAVRYPLELGLSEVRAQLDVRHPFPGQTLAYAVQQCAWGAMEGTPIAVLMDLGFLAEDVSESQVRLRWKNPIH